MREGPGAAQRGIASFLASANAPVSATALTATRNGRSAWFDLNRRQALALGGTSFFPVFCLAAGASAEAADKLTIAFNVNLPSFDPTVGPLVGQSDDPGDLPLDLRSVYRAERRPLARARPADEMGLERRQDQRPGWTCARASSGTTARRSRPKTSSGRSSARATRRAAIRSRSSGARSAISRSKASASPPTCKNFDPTIFKWMAFLTGYVLPKAYYTKVGAEGFEKKPIGTGPYMVDEYQGNAFLRLKRNDKYWGPKPRLRDRHLQVRARRHQPRRRDRERLVRRDARNPLRGIRPAEGQAGPRRRLQAHHRHRHDLHHQCRKGDARRERPPRRDPRHRQGRHRQAAAARLRDADRYPRRAGLRGLRSRRSRSPTIRNWRRSCSPRAAIRRKSRSSSRSRRRAASSRRTTR